MRKLVILITAGVVGCGGSTNTPPTALSGIVGGAGFSPAEVKAIRAGPASSCPAPIPPGTSVAALAISAASYANLCADFSSPFCTFHKNAQSVTIVLASLNASGSAQILPGSYTVSPSVASIAADPNQPGALYVAVAESMRTDAMCALTTGAAPALATGSLRLDQVTGSTVTGHVDVTFSDGGKLQGDFSAPVCAGVSPDICALVRAGGTCATTPTCQ